jgi:hypothetical protein
MSNEKLAAALAAFQADLPAIKKDQTADAGQYSYTYADLGGISVQVMPLLGKHGLAFTAKPTRSPKDGAFVLAYSLMHSSGEREDGEYPLPEKGTPQQLGSAITYGRRYCFCAITGVAPEDGTDDDGQAASTVKHQEPDPVVAARLNVKQAWEKHRGPFDPDDVAADFQAWSQGELFVNAEAPRLLEYAKTLKTGEAP